MLETISNRTPTYSKIIEPKKFIEINADQHIYIKETMKQLKKYIENITNHRDNCAEVIEYGCGPGTFTYCQKKLSNCNVVAIDHDSQFIEYAKQKYEHSNVTFKHADILDYQHDKPADICFSIGVHHHLPKPPTLHLNSIAKQLKDNGIYILIDELLPHYNTLEERRISTIIWHSHVIAHALKHQYQHLAEEEAKILLDDLLIELAPDNIKTVSQIETILEKSTLIDQFSRAGNMQAANELSTHLLEDITKQFNYVLQNDDTFDLSRGDFKICDAELRKEIAASCFAIADEMHLGRTQTIGSLSMYVLSKTHQV